MQKKRHRRAKLLPNLYPPCLRECERTRIAQMYIVSNLWHVFISDRKILVPHRQETGRKLKASRKDVLPQGFCCQTFTHGDAENQTGWKLSNFNKVARTIRLAFDRWFLGRRLAMKLDFHRFDLVLKRLDFIGKMLNLKPNRLL